MIHLIDKKVNKYIDITKRNIDINNPTYRDINAYTLKIKQKLQRFKSISI